MPGGYFQLTMQGPADIYLTGNPSISFFKFVYRRYTPFSMELINLPYNVIPTFSTTQTTEAHCNIDRNADLLSNCYLLYDLPAIYTDNIPFSWADSIGNKIIDEVSIKCDGQNIDRQFGDFMKIESDLTLTSTAKIKYDMLVNGNTNINNIDYPIGNLDYPSLPAKRLLIPFQFWFCKNTGLSIPLIALQYTKLRIDIIYTRLNEIFKIGTPPISPVQMFTPDTSELSENNKIFQAQLISEGWDQTNVFYRFAKSWDQYSSILANYIYLGDDERKKFAQTSHEYLITQVQKRTYLGLMRGPSQLYLTLNYPVKELIWFLRRADAYKKNDWYNFTDNDCPELLNNVKNLRDFLILPCINTLTENSFNNTLTELKNLSMEFTQILNDNYARLFAGEPITVMNSQKWDYYSIMKNAKLVFNGHDRFEQQDNTYFENEEVYKYHSGKGRKGLYVYSFSITPEKDQPSGTCNMSRINEQQLFINIFDTNVAPQINDKFDLHLYATNFNVFRIMGGIGQLVFSN
jgi:hypothetical protein